MKQKKKAKSVLLRENLNLTKEIVSEILDMVNLVSKNTTEPLLSKYEENSNSTGRRGQNRREHHPAIRNPEVIHDYENV